MKIIFFTHEDSFVMRFSQRLECGISIHAVNIDADSGAMLSTVEGRARRVIEAIRKVQPSGPYSVAGRGAHGVIAFEVANQLLGEDQEISFLGLIDSTYEPKTLREFREQSRSNSESLEQAVASYHAEYIPSNVYLFSSEGHSKDSCFGWASVLPKEQIILKSIPETYAFCRHSALDPLRRVFCDAALHEEEALPNVPDNSYSPLEPLQVGIHRSTPLICVPGAGASVTSFVELCMYCARSASIYGLESRGLHGKSVPHATVQAASEYFARVVFGAFGITRYELLGHSFGGWVSFDMAQRLESLGCEIASLTIVDSSAPGDCTLREYFTTDVIMECAQSFELLLGRPLGVRRSVLEGMTAEEQRGVLHQKLVAQGVFPHRSTAADLRGALRVLATALRSSYKPVRPYQGPMKLVLVDDPTLSDEANRCERQRLVESWQLWAPNLKYQHAPGNHMNILKAPNVEVIAKILSTKD